MLYRVRFTRMLIEECELTVESPNTEPILFRDWADDMFLDWDYRYCGPVCVRITLEKDADKPCDVPDIILDDQGREVENE